MAAARARPAGALAILGGFLLAGALVAAGPPEEGAVPPAAAARFADRPLAEALLELRARGLKLVFASNVVRPEMRVESEPRAAAPRAILDELLAPNGLMAWDGPNGTVVVVRRAPPAGASAAGASPEEPATRFEEELVVTAARIALLRDETVGTLGLGREEILETPHLGDDFFRAVTLLPGATGNDVSAEFHVRGGRRDETLILLDGQEIFDAFHLEDFDRALSVIAPETLASADLMTGGFSARFGNRMSGVLDLRTTPPAERRRFRIGAGILGVDAGGAGTLGGDRGGWSVELRRGSSDLIGRFLDAETPQYWDGFGKLDYRLGVRNVVRASWLQAEDRLEFEQTIDTDHKRFDTAYRSAQAWLGLETFLSRDLFVESVAARAEVDRDRHGGESEASGQFEVADRRDSTVRELRQSWNLQASAGHALDWGWQRRSFATDFDYLGARSAGAPTSFVGRLEVLHEGFFAADRIRLAEPLTLELGVRFDRASHPRESHLSPRLNLAWAPAARSVIRLAWGRFDQNQRSYEVQVEDGETALQPVERSEHRVLGFETLIDAGAKAGELALRLEIYRREVSDPRRRYENLFEPVNTFPEMEPDRIRLAPERSRAQGAELSLAGRLGDALRWRANYTRASTADEIDGRWIPRLYDQRHGLNVDLDLRLTANWRLAAAWRYHSGWPTTPLTLVPVEDATGRVELVPVLGRLDSRRVRPYHRLDLRASRSWRRRASVIDLYFDVQNAYDRENVSGFDVEVDAETGSIVATPETWPGILVSAGVRVEF